MSVRCHTLAFLQPSQKQNRILNGFMKHGSPYG
jgi:hypothetical protein